MKASTSGCRVHLFTQESIYYKQIKNNALLHRLQRRGKIKPVSGGRTIVQEIQYQENTTYKRYAGYDLLNIQPSDVITAAEYDWKQAVAAVSISGLEELQNRGDARIIDLLEERIENAERTIKNNIALDCYSDGTADGGKQIGGLKLLISTSPTSGTVGGINRALWPFWQNQAWSALTNGGGAMSATNIQSNMNSLYLKLVRGTDKPDLIVADNGAYGYYLQSLQTIQRITSNEMAEAGFVNLKYMNSDVVLDGGYGGGAPTNTMYFVNSEYLFFRPHKDRNFAPIGGDRVNPNQDAVVKLLGWAGNVTMNNAFLQGVLSP